MLIVRIQCLLRVDGSILAGVFLTSFVLCLNLYIPSTQQIAAYRKLGTQTSLVQLVATKSTVASETGGFSAPWIPVL